MNQKKNNETDQDTDQDPALAKIRQLWPIIPVWFKLKILLMAFLWAEMPWQEKVKVAWGWMQAKCA